MVYLSTIFYYNLCIMPRILWFPGPEASQRDQYRFIFAVFPYFFWQIIHFGSFLIGFPKNKLFHIFNFEIGTLTQNGRKLLNMNLQGLNMAALKSHDSQLFNSATFEVSGSGPIEVSAPISNLNIFEIGVVVNKHRTHLSGLEIEFASQSF